MPRILTALAMFLSLTAAADPARALPLTESVSLPPDAGGLKWHVDARQPGAQGTNEEWVPAGQTGKNWTEMITVREYKPGTDVPKLVTEEVQLLANACKSYQIMETHQGVGRAIPMQINGPRYNYAKFDVLVRCDDPLRADAAAAGLRKHEVIWFKGMHGQKGNYLVQRAWHGDLIGPDTVLGAPKVHDAWQAWIDNVGLNADIGSPAK
jgi:hypothetical protein